MQTPTRRLRAPDGADEARDLTCDDWITERRKEHADAGFASRREFG
jgi:hypothetical protein